MIVAREFGVWDVDAFMSSISLEQLTEWVDFLNDGASEQAAPQRAKQITDSRMMEAMARMRWGNNG